MLSADVPARHVPASLADGKTGRFPFPVKTVFLQPHEKWEDAAVSVETLVSNDTGVAFCIELPGESRLPASGDGTPASAKQIYFAGDLNAWNWDGDEEDMALIHIYHEELKRITGVVFDVAFIPLDPRLGEDYTQGITDFFDVCGCNARTVVPMHCWEKYAIMERAKKKLAGRYYAGRIATYSHEGEIVTFSS